MILLVIIMAAGIMGTVPIGIALGGATLIAIFDIGQYSPSMVAQLAATGLDSFTLLSIPFFVLAGELMSTGGISRKIVEMAHCFVKNLTGALSIITILACTFFAAISGSGPATVSAIGGMMIPEMEKEKYDKAWAAAITCCGGIIGVIIPPSIPFVLYGVITGASIGDLFLAGIGPGLLICVVLCIYSYFACKKYGYGENIEETLYENKGIWVTFKDSFAALMTPVIILGGIYSGVFTPTEAAVIACAWAILVGKFVYKELNWKTLIDAVSGTAVNSSMCLFTIAMASSFSSFVTMRQIPAKFGAFVTSVTTNEYVILLLILGFLLLIGCFIDNISSMTIVTPIFAPIVTSLGYDLVHLGVFMTVALAIGFVTPPYGANLFVASGITKLSVPQISKKIWPMIILLIGLLLVITFVPQITMWLPDMVRAAQG